MALTDEEQHVAAKIALHELGEAYGTLAALILDADPTFGIEALNEVEKRVAARLHGMLADPTMGQRSDILAAAAQSIRTPLRAARPQTEPGQAPPRQQ